MKNGGEKRYKHSLFYNGNIFYPILLLTGNALTFFVVALWQNLFAWVCHIHNETKFELAHPRIRGRAIVDIQCCSRRESQHITSRGLIFCSF